MENASIQMYAHVKLDGMALTVMNVFLLVVVSMEAVTNLWNVTAVLAGLEDNVINPNVMDVSMDAATNLTNAFVILDGKDPTAQNVQHCLTAKMGIVLHIPSNANVSMDGLASIAPNQSVGTLATL